MAPYAVANVKSPKMLRFSLMVIVLEVVAVVVVVNFKFPNDCEFGIDVTTVLPDMLYIIVVNDEELSTLQFIPDIEYDNGVLE